MPRGRALFSALRRRVRHLAQQAGRGTVNESDLIEAERLARILELSARGEVVRTSVLFASFLVLAMVLLAIPTGSVAVRIRVETRSAAVEFPAGEVIAARITGDEVTVTGASAEAPPAEFDSLLAHSIDAITVSADSDGVLALQRLQLQPGARLDLRARGGSVDLQVACRGTCRESLIELTAVGHLRSSSGAAFAEVPVGIELRPQRNPVAVQVASSDTVGLLLQGPVLINAMSFQTPRFVDEGGTSAIASISAVRGGQIHLLDFPTRTREILAGDNVVLAGPDLRILEVERRAESLVFSIDGRASKLVLGTGSVKPTLWEVARAQPIVRLLVAFAGGVMGFLALWNLLRILLR